MATDDTIRHVLELGDIEANRQAQIGRLGGDVSAGVDFAAGGDQNVIVKKVGNYVPNGCIKAWRERDTFAAVGRYVHYFNELELRAEEIWADADGLGLPMVDQLAAAGWKVNRFYGGTASPHSRYKNLISYAWHEVAQKVRKHQIIMPDNQTLIAQLASRRVKYAQDGRLWLENKHEMREREVGRPDVSGRIRDGVRDQPAKSYLWTPVTNNWPEIAKRHGWQYGGDSSEEYDDSYADRRNWNRQPDESPIVGFGGVHSIW